ncbi:MAG: hypothetical protein K2P81_06425 [Bacteriovoracaceae bacterium]|nr:hypothetical protein [Bacteriovoracaceae bacterium]
MKSIMTIAALTLMTSAFAADIKITSFNFVRSGEPAAELCGEVSNATSTPSYVRVAVDHKTARPAIYNTIAGADGRFCLSVITWRGTAEASVFGESARTQSFVK